MRLYASRPEPFRTPTPPQPVPPGWALYARWEQHLNPAFPTQLNYAKNGQIQKLRTAYANKPLINERS